VRNHKSSWIIRTPSSASKLRLFCFPYAGGSAFNFTRWQDVLDPSIEVCGIQLPGRGARISEERISSMPELLRALAPEFSKFNDLPFVFFGHSVGALIAFELTRYLRLHGMQLPSTLIVSGCQAPRYRSQSRQLHTYDDDAFVDVLRRYAGTPAEVLHSKELMQLLLPAIRADFALAENYRYRYAPSLTSPIHVFAGTEDENKASGQVCGWQEETGSLCEITWFDGGHFFINDSRAAVLKRLDEILAVVAGSRAHA
jgi:surfactin synthase thioesterase subunit